MLAALVLSTAVVVLGLNYENLLEDFPPLVANETADEDLMEDLATFVRDDGIQRGIPQRRGEHNYIYPADKVYKDKCLDLMKQVIYAAQEHMKELAPVLDKYQGDPGFRMKFIFNRLQQFTVDMRRIYTLAIKRSWGIKVSDHIRLYQHLTKKHIDAIYVVDHVIDLHEQYMAEVLLDPRLLSAVHDYDDRRGSKEAEMEAQLREQGVTADVPDYLKKKLPGEGGKIGAQQTEPPDYMKQYMDKHGGQAGPGGEMPDYVKKYGKQKGR